MQRIRSYEAVIRACANGDRCCSVPALGGPARLSLSNAENICHACQERDFDGQIAPPVELSPDGGLRYTVAEAAEELGCTANHVSYLIATARLGRDRPAPGQKRISASELVRFRATAASRAPRGMAP